MFDLSKNKKKIDLNKNIFYKDDVVIFEHNNINKSIEVVKKNKKKISAVFLEPIQASCPNYISENYVKQIYNYCNKNNILIIFDEIITGLRFYELSVFSKLKLNPDIVTFAKVFGGGLPIGLCCINAKINKKIKNSGKKIFFGGTFSNNPFSSKVGNDTFHHIKKNRKEIF